MDTNKSSFTISVITVCYNSAATLEKALQSVAAQSWPHVEHIVIDGGSNDGTQDILMQHASQLAKVVSEPDRGIYDAMNKGLALASGQVVCFLNSDDAYAHGDVLAIVARTMREGFDAVFGDVAFVNSKNSDRIIRRYRSARFSPERLAYGWMPAHPALFIKREVFLNVGGFRIDYRIAGDFEFIVRAFYKNTLRYTYLPEVFVKMQTGGASTSGWRSKMLLNREVLRACRENNIKTNIFKILSKYPAKLLELFRT
jgi:glycosyltransferase involved in cell wall biosynthesis